jgi:putative ABC transport system permease protein
MPFSTLILMALRSLWRNKSRSILTMLGVIIGVGSVILLVAIGNGLKEYVTEQFEQFGANNIYVAPGNLFGEGSSGFGGNDQVTALLSNTIVYDDVGEIKRLREHVDGVSGMTMNSANVSYKRITKKPTIVGVNAEYGEITNTGMTVGNFFTRSDEDRKSQVVVLGYKLADDLFGSVDPIGKTILLKNRPFKVIGVAEEKGGGFGGPSFDEYVYMPITTGFQLFDSRIVVRIIASARSEASVQPAIRDIEEFYLQRLEEDEFSVFKQDEILKVIDQVLGALTAGLGGIAAISLVVGGIGIMNIMLVSVTERTREIGLRKALGATPNIILVQFLIESVVLSVAGGLIGVGIAYGLSAVISQFIPASVTLSAVMLAFGVSATVGIVFGVYPARKASQLSPIEALRYE